MKIVSELCKVYILIVAIILLILCRNLGIGIYHSQHVAAECFTVDQVRYIGQHHLHGAMRPNSLFNKFGATDAVLMAFAVRLYGLAFLITIFFH